MISWIIVGMFLGPVIYIYLPLTLLVLKGKNQYMEMLLGFFLILIISDSRIVALNFAENAKLIYIIFLALFLILNLKDFKPLSPFQLRFIPFYIVAVLCIFNSPSDYLVSSIEKTASYILLLFVVPNYIKRAQLDHGKEFYTALIYLGFSILVVSFALKLIDPAVVTREGRFEGVFGNPNGMGLFSLLFCMLFNIILNMYPDLIAPRWKRIIYIAIFLAIILCGSRGSLFGILIYFLFSFIYKKSSFIGTVLAILFAFSYSYISYNIVNIITLLKLEDYLRINTFEEASGRFIAWKFTWDHIQENFWIGRGFEYTTYLFSIPENVVYLNSLGHLGNVHNSYLTLWLDTGLVGLSAFVIAFISCFISAIRKTILAIPLMYAAVFSSFFESWLTASLNPFTIILFITLSIILSNVTIPAKASPAVSLQ